MNIKYLKSITIYALLSIESLSKKALIGMESRKHNSICVLGITQPLKVFETFWKSEQSTCYHKEFIHLQNTLRKLVY